MWRDNFLREVDGFKLYYYFDVSLQVVSLEAQLQAADLQRQLLERSLENERLRRRLESGNLSHAGNATSNSTNMGVTNGRGTSYSTGLIRPLDEDADFPDIPPPPPLDSSMINAASSACSSPSPKSFRAKSFFARNALSLKSSFSKLPTNLSPASDEHLTSRMPHSPLQEQRLALSVSPVVACNPAYSSSRYRHRIKIIPDELASNISGLYISYR